jgi:3-phenylpropionate/cinnamic acid dioxygenase small subunit
MEKQLPVNRLDELKEAIEKAPQRIEDEFKRTVNPWLSCFKSSIFVVETYLDSQKVRELLPAEDYKKAEERLEELKERVFRLEEQYPTKKTSPPEETRQELLKKLNILKKEED